MAVKRRNVTNTDQSYYVVGRCRNNGLSYCIRRRMGDGGGVLFRGAVREVCVGIQITYYGQNTSLNMSVLCTMPTQPPWV